METTQIKLEVNSPQGHSLASPGLISLLFVGVQMAAIVNQVKRITSGYKGGSTLRLPDSIICRYLPRTLGYLLSCSK